MKRLFGAVLGVLMLVFAPVFVYAATVGQPAPDFRAVDYLGQVHQLSDFAGQTVVLEWTNYGCPFVRKFYDATEMQRLQREAQAQGVVWLSVISSAPGKQGHLTAATAAAAIADEGFAGTAVLLDESGDMGRAYGATNTPHMYVIDGAGVLQYAGAIDSIPSFRQSDIEKAENYVMAALAALERGEAPSPAQTNAYGCSVKYQ